MLTYEILAGDAEAHEKLTARLFWKLRAETTYNDAGNVKEFADATARNLVTRARAENGARYVNDEQVDLNHEAFTFLLDEQTTEQAKLIGLARRLADESQAQYEATAATLQDVAVERWSLIGSYNIANVTVTGSLSGEAEEDVDYELDKENGRLRVIQAGGITAGEDLTVTFDSPALNFEKYETQYTSVFRVDVVIEEHNAFSRTWLRRRTGSGYLNVTEFPNQTGEFGTYRVKFTPDSPMTVLKRPEAQTLPSATASVEGAGRSSSSSSGDDRSASSLSTSSSSS